MRLITGQTSNEESSRGLGKANRDDVEELACIERLNEESVGDAQSACLTVEVVPFLLGPCAAQVCWPTEGHSHNVWPRRWQLRGTGPQPEKLSQISPRPKWKRLTNAADIVESSKPHFPLLLNFTQTRTRNAKADQVKNNAVAVLSQGARLSDIAGRTTELLAQASNPS